LTFTAPCGPLDASALHINIRRRSHRISEQDTMAATYRLTWSPLAKRAQLKPTSKPLVRVSEAEAANDFPSLLAREYAPAPKL